MGAFQNVATSDWFVGHEPRPAPDRNAKRHFEMHPIPHRQQQNHGEIFIFPDNKFEVIFLI
jgi:hypothetical protein